MRGYRSTIFEVLALPVGLIALYFAMPLDHVWLSVTSGVVLVVLLVPMTVRRVRHILDSPTPGIAAVQAVTMMATALVVGFAIVHRSISLAQPDQYDGLDTDLDGLYFTMTTVSTVGYGDIVATGQLARGVVTFQMLCNLVFIGGALKLISWAARSRTPLERLGRPESSPS